MSSNLSIGQRTRRRGQEQASVLLVTLLTAAILGLGLASCLVLVNAQRTSVARSQAWNCALAMAEAGIEEAMAQMNSSPTDFSASGWGAPSQSGIYGPVSRTLASGRYAVSILTNQVTSVVSTGIVALAYPSISLSRTVRVTVTNQALIFVAFAARGSVQMNGNGLASDSFNSHDPNLSTNGQYDSAKTSTNGSVASVSGVVNLGNHNIAGSLYLGVGASYSSGTSQVSGKIYSNANFNFPDATLPTTTWFSAPTENIANGKKTQLYYHFTSSGDYTVSDSTPILVDPGVKVRLKVTDPNFSPADIHIQGATTNSGTLTIYQMSGSASLSGNTTVDSMRAENFWYFGLSGVTSVTFGGNSSNVGVIYAPSADLTLNGGGNNNGLIGSSITKTITMNGHYNFHYDEALRQLGPSSGYLVNSWQEL